MKHIIYLDDVRTPLPLSNEWVDDMPEWIVVRSYEEFVNKVEELKLENIELISLDHDLGESAMMEWHTNVATNFELNYNNITEKTGMDCTKWLVDKWMNGAPVCKVMVHSANAIGSANMMGYINNYKHVSGLTQDCARWVVPFTIRTKENE